MQRRRNADREVGVEDVLLTCVAQRPGLEQLARQLLDEEWYAVGPVEDGVADGAGQGFSPRHLLDERQSGFGWQWL